MLESAVLPRWWRTRRLTTFGPRLFFEALCDAFHTGNDPFHPTKMYRENDRRIMKNCERLPLALKNGLR
jgi:hypothetical protein